MGYAIVGLSLIEGADVVFSRLSLPLWTVDFVLWAVLLGLPAALILSWFFDFSSEGIKLTPVLTPEEETAHSPELLGPGTWALMGAGIVVVLISGYLALGRDRSTAAPPAASDGPRGVAVLPFRNLGPPETESFVAGMASELTDKLSMVEGLSVPSRTSADTYGDSEKTLPLIGQELGVEFVLEGEVRRESFCFRP